MKDEVLEDGSERTVLSLPPALATCKSSDFAIGKKKMDCQNLQKKFNDLKYDFNVISEKRQHRKRYRRQDAIGTPFCITVDHDSLQMER